MAASGGYPKWLLDSKEHISKGSEWNAFLEELYDAVQQQLTESHVQAFSDLTDAEKTLFVERAARVVQGGQPYTDIYSQVSVSLDQHLNNDVSRQLLEEYPLSTKTDLVLDNALEGSISLLKRWPDMKSKLHVCFNQPLPDPLRQLAWRLYLGNAKVRKQYADILIHNPRTAISPLDMDISQKCEHLLMSEPTFAAQNGSVGSFYGMKAVLSYHHTLKGTRENLLDTDYLLLVPFLFVAGNTIPRKEPAPDHLVALLVEEYLTLMTSRPGYVVDSGTQVHDEEFTAFSGRVAALLKKHSPEASQAILDAFVPSKEMIVATEKGGQAVMTDAVEALVRPIIRNMFVGYVKMNVVLFLWDQYIIGMDSPGFHDEYLPVVTAIFLMLLKERLMHCKSSAAMENCLVEEGVKLKVQQFQYEINKLFYEDLFNKLHQEDKAALPILDPTQSKYPPWEHWFHDRIPNRTTAGDRRRAREERQAERDRLLQQQREEERRKKQEAERRQREEEHEHHQQAKQDRQRIEEDRLYLEDQLEQERRQRLESEREAQMEIERLKRELDYVRRKGLKSANPSMMSVESRVSNYLIPPPPSVATHSSPLPAVGDMHTKTPVATSPPGDQAKDVLVDILRKTVYTFQKIGHGEGGQKRELDELTKKAILKHKDDVKLAEREVFGRELKPGEFEKLSQSEKMASSDKMMDVIKRNLQEHRQQELLGNNR